MCAPRILRKREKLPVAVQAGLHLAVGRFIKGVLPQEMVIGEALRLQTQEGP